MAELQNPILFVRVNKFLGKDVKFLSIFETIEELLKVGEQERQKYATLSESIAESDIIINRLQEEITRWRKRYLELKNKTSLEVYEENLRLIKENAKLKEDGKSMSVHTCPRCRSNGYVIRLKKDTVIIECPQCLKYWQAPSPKCPDCDKPNGFAVEGLCVTCYSDQLNKKLYKGRG